MPKTLAELQNKHKRFTNGHKTFTSAEMESMHELLHHEDTRRNNFEKNKHSWRMPRNPLTGEETPRENEGEFIIQPQYREFQTVRLKESPRVSEPVGYAEKQNLNMVTRSIHTQRTASLAAKRNAMDDQLSVLRQLIDKRQTNLVRSMERNNSKFR
jgi:hypothetical protein